MKFWWKIDLKMPPPSGTGGPSRVLALVLALAILDHAGAGNDGPTIGPLTLVNVICSI